jgi:hypothetical protein
VRTFSSAALGLWLSVSGTALGQSAAPALPVEPGALKLSQAPAVSANQQLANTIGAQLRQNANLRGYRIDVSVASGVAELHGVVADAAQRDEAVRTAQAVPGVERVERRHARTGTAAADARAAASAGAAAAPGCRAAGRAWGDASAAGADLRGEPERAQSGAAAAAAAAVRLADLRPLQQLLAGRLSDEVSGRGVAVHRPHAPLPARAAGLAGGDAALGRRTLVVRPHRDRPRLVAHSILVTAQFRMFPPIA